MDVPSSRYCPFEKMFFALRISTNILIDIVREHDPLSVLTHVFYKQKNLLSTLESKMGHSRNFEQHFCAQLAKFIALENVNKFNDTITALYPLETPALPVPKTFYNGSCVSGK